MPPSSKGKLKYNPRALISSPAFIAAYINHALKDLNPIKTYNNFSTGSIYISLENPELGTIRIADHPGGSQELTRWNIRKDLDTIVSTKEFKVMRYFYPFAAVRQCCEDIKRFNDDLKSGRITLPMPGLVIKPYKRKCKGR